VAMGSDLLSLSRELAFAERELIGTCATASRRVFGISAGYVADRGFRAALTAEQRAFFDAAISPDPHESNSRPRANRCMPQSPRRISLAWRAPSIAGRVGCAGRGRDRYLSRSPGRARSGRRRGVLGDESRDDDGANSGICLERRVAMPCRCWNDSTRGASRCARATSAERRIADHDRSRRLT